MSRCDSLGRWLTVALLLNGAASVAAQNRMPANWDTEVTRALRTFVVPGMAMAVVRDGRALPAKGDGVSFALNPDGSKMAAVSPLADFRFEYQALLFVPAR